MEKELKEAAREGSRFLPQSVFQTGGEVVGNGGLNAGIDTGAYNSGMLKARTFQSVVVFVAITVSAWIIGAAWGQTARPVVYVISIEGIIDLGLAPFLSRILEEAQEAGAAAVVLDINTFGGRVDAAVAMRDAL